MGEGDLVTHRNSCQNSNRLFNTRREKVPFKGEELRDKKSMFSGVVSE